MNLFLIFALPLLSFFILISCNLLGITAYKNKLVQFSSIATFLCFILSLFKGYSFINSIGFSGYESIEVIQNWINIPELKASLSIEIDLLSIIMISLVSGISFLVHIYSIFYMKKDLNKVKFFALIDLFTFVMMFFVSSLNLLNIFITWELLAFVSYLLIIYNKTPESMISGTKVFLINKISDVALILCLSIIYGIFKTFDLIEIANNINLLTTEKINMLVALLTISAFIKSAQLGFQTWIADAMQAPTPASVLIHSSTLVSAGVILICRTSFIFNQSFLLEYIALFALISSVITAIIAANQSDIKKILAYSTSSQLGFMIFACGIGAYVAAIFHLITHALFKSLLFMGAGEIIHQNKGSHNIFTQKISKESYMFLFLIMWIGIFSLMGLPPFNGFFSKERVFISGLQNSNLGFLALSVSLFTAFYSARLMFVLFNKKPSKSRRIINVNTYIALPMIILAVFTGVSSIFTERFNNLIVSSGLLKINYINACHDSHLVMLLSLLSVVVVCFGIVLTYIYIVKNNKFLKRLSIRNKGWFTLFENSLELDYIYKCIFVKPIFICAKLILKVEHFFSVMVIDLISVQLLDLMRYSSKRRKEFVVANTALVVLGISLILAIYIILSVLNLGGK